MSMSYCIIENTAKDLEEAAVKIRERLEAKEKLSTSEYAYLTMLVEWAQDIVDLNDNHDFHTLDPKAKR